MSEPPVADWPYVHLRYGSATCRFHAAEVRAALSRYKRWRRATTQAAREAARQAHTEAAPLPPLE
jgi:hypothetical protein